ncbi:MAG TPA: sugar ABC transporter permease, partial [Bacteroidetes bacterium]|nr:sugar ABC transporter permease [Bacteroidota bacterium]
LLLNLHGSTWIVDWFQPGRVLVMVVIIFIDAWRVTPVVFLIVLMALEQLSESFLEAARLDGATRWQLIRFIQIPLIVPALMVAIALRAVDAFRIFATPLVLLGVEALPVITSVAYHYKAEANNPAAANVTALSLAVLLFAGTLVTILFTAKKRDQR